MKQATVYILKCSDDSLYTGVTSNLEQRLYDHNTGRFRGYTHNKRPVSLLWNSDELDIQDAILLERQIKKWGRQKKLALIEGDWKLLQELSRCKNLSSHKSISLDSARDDDTKIFMSRRTNSGSKSAKSDRRTEACT